MRIKRSPDGSDTAVHHIGRGDHVSPSLGVGQGCFGKDLQSFVVVYVMAAENTAVAVVCIFAHAYVCNYIEIGIFGLDGADSLLYNTLAVPGGGTLRVLFSRQSKEDAPAYAGVNTGLYRLIDSVQPIVKLAV